MLKRFMFALMSFLIVGAPLKALESDYITYDWLLNSAQTTSYSDHIPHFRRLFNTMKVRGFLECGLGYSTKYFLDNCDLVISIEYINSGYGLQWYQEAVRMFTGVTNWIPMTFNETLRSNSFNNACAYQCSLHKDYALIDPSYLKELDKHFKEQITNAKFGGYDIDVGFVDPGCYIRGDMVKVLLANKIPVVAAHDTASDRGTKEVENLYGWNKVVTPPDYVKVYIPFGQGTTFWINKSLPDVVASMIAYRDAIQQILDERFHIEYSELTELADAL